MSGRSALDGPEGPPAVAIKNANNRSRIQPPDASSVVGVDTLVERQGGADGGGGRTADDLEFAGRPRSRRSRTAQAGQGGRAAGGRGADGPLHVEQALFGPVVD